MNPPIPFPPEHRLMTYDECFKLSQLQYNDAIDLESVSRVQCLIGYEKPFWSGGYIGNGIHLTYAVPNDWTVEEQIELIRKAS